MLSVLRLILRGLVLESTPVRRPGRIDRYSLLMSPWRGGRAAS